MVTKHTTKIAKQKSKDVLKINTEMYNIFKIPIFINIDVLMVIYLHYHKTWVFGLLSFDFMFISQFISQ